MKFIVISVTIVRDFREFWRFFIKSFTGLVVLVVVFICTEFEKT